MDYLDFFNLSEDPFRLTPDTLFFYPSRGHNEILSSLNYAVEQKEGFFLATGEPGTGKTTILKVFINEWKEKAEIALIMTPRLNPEEFLIALIEDLKIALDTTNKNEAIKLFRDFLVKHSSSGRRVIIIVDEAQNLPDQTLEELRLLSNLETDKEKLLQIILIGQPELRSRLLSSAMTQLNQRITIRGMLKPMSMHETSDYINYRIVKAGNGSVNFEASARKMLYGISKGIPRLINLISSRAMMAAYLDTSRSIKKRHIIYAVRHLLDESFKPKRWSGFMISPALAASLVALAVLAALATFGNRVVYMPNELFKSVFSGKAANSDRPNHPAPPGERHGADRKMIIVAAEGADLKSAPSPKSESVFQAERGSSFVVISEFIDTAGGKWYKVMTAKGRECWISANAVKAAE